MISDIPWAKVPCGSGLGAQDVPDLLAQLKNCSFETRLDAYSRLFDLLWHQGTVYEASYQILPFLRDLLVDPDCAVKSELAFLIASIGIGESSFSQLERNPQIDWTAVLRHRNTTIQEEASRGKVLVQSIHKLVGMYIPDLIPFLEDHSAEIRIQIAELLQRYPDLRDQTLPKIKNALKQESDDHVRSLLNKTREVLESVS